MRKKTATNYVDYVSLKIALTKPLWYTTPSNSYRTLHPTTLVCNTGLEEAASNQLDFLMKRLILPTSIPNNTGRSSKSRWSKRAALRLGKQRSYTKNGAKLPSLRYHDILKSYYYYAHPMRGCVKRAVSRNNGHIQSI